MVKPTCTEPDCDKPSRNKSGTAMCKMHYHRWYRHCSTDMVATRVQTRPNAGSYRSRMAPNHPLASKSGKVYVHRLVLWTAIGPGWHDCHWCERQVCWELDMAHADTLQVDHLNSQRDDNDLSNLVASCRDCNAGRGAQHRHDVLTANGYWSGSDTIAGLRSGGRVVRVELRKVA